MKKLKYIAALAMAYVSLGLVSQASATIIDLGQTNSSPANTIFILNRLQGQIDLYNASHDPDLPAAMLLGNDRHENLSGISIDIDITGWTYLVLAWDGRDQMYFVGDDTGIVTFNSTVFNQNGEPQALSHYVLFNPHGVAGRRPWRVGYGPTLLEELASKASRSLAKLEKQSGRPLDGHFLF